MGEMDRRGFMRLGRRKGAEDKKPEISEPAEPTAKDLQIRELADFTNRLLADVEAENDELLAEGAVLTKAFDLAYIRVTAGYVVYSVVTGFSGLVKTSDVMALDTDPPVESKGHGNLVLGVLRFRHTAEMPGVLRTFAFRFVEDSPLIAAIRTACDLPEPEPEEEVVAEERPDDYYDPEEEGVRWE
jgi:hypothetical protein